jgi:UDP-N-acetylmuramate dehydrogenase
MAYVVQENIPLALYSTFRMGGTARYFIELTDEKDITEVAVFAKEKQIPVVILGGGSNTLFTSEKLDALVLKVSIKGYIWQEEDSIVLVTVSSGELWDDFVEQSVLRGLSGIEALSLIPGTVGGTPVQNVGAYGQEVRNTIVSIRAYDTEKSELVIFTNDMCEFSYRDSIFRHLPNRYIITNVTFKLSKEKPHIPNYPGVTRYFEEHGMQNPTLKDIREAICAIRQTKLPDPKNIASVGSFFKNPFVSREQANELKTKYPIVVLFPVDDQTVKVGAGWLIDTLGLKGQTFGNLGLYPENALVIVNNGNATGEELKELVVHIQKLVKTTFGIEIEPEPLFVE